MGIKGLLPCLQSITRHVEMEKYRGLTVAVDAMCWLHKGVFTGNVSALAKYQNRTNAIMEAQHERQCKTNGDSILASTVKRLDFDTFASARRNRMDATKNQGWDDVDATEAMTKCIDYVTRHVNILQKQYGLDIILVIDGDSLPIKHEVNEERQRDREEAFRQALQAERKGDNRQARKLYSKACSITYEMRHMLILQCTRYNIQFMVAPYEADAQMAKLAHAGNVDLIITEDSDLLVYGCPRVLFKIDFKSGKGEEIQLMRHLAMNEPLSFRHWNHDMFVYMCILAGCDYCKGISGVGLQKAHKLVRIHRKPKKILNALQNDGKLPDKFEDLFWNAYRTFRHQRVFCPQNRIVDHLFEVREVFDKKDNEWNFLGPSIESSIGIGIAEGLLHPKEKIPWESAKIHLSNQRINKYVQRSNTKQQGKATTPQRKRLPIDRSPFEKEKIDELESADKNLFAFFKSKGRKEPKRPPLQVISFDDNTSNYVRSHQPARRKSGISRMVMQPIPSNYHDYSSNLVSNEFKPVSGHNNMKSKKTRRSGVSKAIRELKQKLSKERSKKKEQIAHRSKETLTQVNEGHCNLLPASTSNCSDITPGIGSIDHSNIYNTYSHARVYSDQEAAADINNPFQCSESIRHQMNNSDPMDNACNDNELIQSSLDIQMADTTDWNLDGKMNNDAMKSLGDSDQFDYNQNYGTNSLGFRNEIPLHHEKNYNPQHHNAGESRRRMNHQYLNKTEQFLTSEVYNEPYDGSLLLGENYFSEENLGLGTTEGEHFTMEVRDELYASKLDDRLEYFSCL